MPVTSGFFDSTGGDRKYNALQMSSVFDGIILDGVYANYGQAFAVTPGTGLSVIVGTGRAWFRHTWTLNDSPLTLTLPAAHATYHRWDAIVLDVDETARSNTITYVSGAAASTPVLPTLINTATRRQYPLAYVRRRPSTSGIVAADIQTAVGTNVCPYVTSPLKTISIDQHVASWQNQFSTWFNNLSVTLQTNAAAAMLSRIMKLEQWIGSDGNPATNAYTRRTTFRGKHLGTSFTAAQKAAIGNGSFTGIYLGDYWTLGGRQWRVVDFNYWSGSNDGAGKNNHIVVMPDSPLYSSPMGTKTNLGVGYYGSIVYNGMHKAREWAGGLFGNDMLLSRTAYLSGAETFKQTWYAYQAVRLCDIPTEIQVFGANIYGKPMPTADKGQFALFRIRRDLVMKNGTYWLQGSRGDGRTATVKPYGNGSLQAELNTASYGVLPVYAIGPKVK